MSDNLYLFANNNGGHAENNGSYRLYNMKIEGDSEGVESGVNYVDYIRSDGNSYIDTNLTSKPNTKVEIRMSNINFINNRHFFGSELLALGFQVQMSNWTYYKHSNIGGILNGMGKYHTLNSKDFTDITMDVLNPKNIININGNDVGTGNEISENTSKATIKIFTSNNLGYGNYGIVDNNIQNRMSIYSLHYFKIYEGDNLVQDLRPCLDIQGIPCMYDEVSKKYFYNQGTGTFGYKKTLREFQPVLDSNNIPCLLDKINNKFYYNKGIGSFTYGGNQTPKDGYTEIEYIESNGTQYIDTGVVPNSNTDIDMTCRAVSNGGYILNKLQLDTTYKYNGTDTTAQPNLTASTGATLTMGSQNIAYLTEAEIAQAVLNGWTIQ